MSHIKLSKYCDIEAHLGVTMDSELSFDEHINIKIDTANKIVGIIRRSYRYLNCESFLPLYKCLVRSHFHYAVSVWDPYKVKHITDIEDVQRRTTNVFKNRLDKLWENQELLMDYRSVDKHCCSYLLMIN